MSIISTGRACKTVYPGSIPGVASSLHCTAVGSANQTKACFQSRRGFVIGKRIRARAAALFPGSSVVEQPAVNRLVAGSNPARGAKLNQ